jgi:uncharacterized protein YfdQ (DUF2303 family)
MDAIAIKQIVDSLAKPLLVELGPDQKAAFLPEGMTVQDLRAMMPPPNRIKQSVRLLTVASFLDYVNLFKNVDSSIFANEATGRYEAVVDYHLSKAPEPAEGVIPSLRGNQDHVAFYECPQSDQCKAWTGKSGTWFGQVDFAEFLETNLREITSPPGATFLQLALDLQIHKGAEFESEVRLDNGQTKFRYSETIRGTTKAGDIEIPSAFTLTLPVFVDGSSHKLEARFRYRMEEGKLKLGYQLIRSNEVWNAAVKAVTKEIRAGAKDVRLYAGSRS